MLLKHQFLVPLTSSIILNSHCFWSFDEDLLKRKRGANILNIIIKR